MKAYVKLVNGKFGERMYFISPDQDDNYIYSDTYSAEDSFYDVIKTAIKNAYGKSINNIISYYKTNDYTIVYVVEVK